MKSTFKSVMVTFVAFVISLSFSGLFAQQTVDLSMVKSLDALRNYALSISKIGSRNVYSQSMDWDWPQRLSYTNFDGAYGEAILDKLFNTEFVYRLTNPEDQISGYVYLYDGNTRDYGNCLFWGYASYTLADLKVGRPQYNIWMQNIPLPTSNVSSAEVLALDEDERTARRIPLEINSRGQVMFQPWLAGAPNGILVIKGNDDSLFTYDLSKPVGEVPTGSSESSAAWKVDGHYVYNGDNQTGKTTLKIVELWNRPTAFLRFGSGQSVTVDVMGLVQVDGTTSFERPFSMEVEEVGGSSWTIILDTTKPSIHTFPPTIGGGYRIRFNWINFGKPNTIYTGPDGGLGKG